MRLFILLSVLTVTYALFRDETFYYKGEEMRMPTSIEVVLNRIGTVPRSMKLNSLCNVPDFQLLHQNNTMKRSTLDHPNYIELLRTLDEKGCEMVRMCDLGGTLGSAGACPKGSLKHILTDKCINALKDALLEKAANIGDMAKMHAVSLLNDTLSSVQKESAEALSNMLAQLEKSIGMQIDKLESTILAAVTGFTAEFARSTRETFQDVTRQIEHKLDEINNAAEENFGIINNAMSNMKKEMDTKISEVQELMLSINILLADAIESLSSYMRESVDLINYDNIKVEENIEKIKETLSAILIGIEQEELLLKQGVDIAVLLMKWMEISNNTFQGINTNKYRHVYKSFISNYSIDSIPVDPQDEIIGLGLYRCYARGPENSISYNKSRRYRDDNMSVLVADHTYSILNEVDTEYHYLLNVTSNYTATMIIPSTNNFILEHPVVGNMHIHRCERIMTEGIVYDNGNAILVLHNSTIVPSIYGTGKKSIKVAGLSGKRYLNVVVRQHESEEILRPNKYYYTKDEWCCDDSGYPILSGLSCNSSGLSKCTYAEFANCTVGGSIVYEKLREGKCSTGTIPTIVERLYLSPRMYYCTPFGKTTDPIHTGFTYCEVEELDLPGAGVELYTGIMSPEGLYPANCIFWNTVFGEAGLYSIDITERNITIPTMLYNLKGSRVIFEMDGSIVIDEMDQIYGAGNGGYDCLRYEMDKFLHKPRNCRSYDLPEYNATSYFSGKVRSTGLSKYLDYFDIALQSVTNESISLLFTLKPGIDYEAAYIEPNNLCPDLSVSYITIDGKSYCDISGWAGFNHTVEINGESTCNNGICYSNIYINNNSSFTVDVIDKGKRVHCYKFLCLSSYNSFVAYPTETFYENVNRTRKMEAVSRLSGYDYANIVKSIIDEFNKAINNTIVDTGIIEENAVYNYSMSINMSTPEIAILELEVQKVAADAKAAIQNISLEKREEINYDVEVALQNMYTEVNVIMDVQTKEMNTYVEEIKKNTTIMVEAIESSLFDFIEREKEAIAATVESTIIPILSIIAAIGSILLSVRSWRKSK